MDKTPNRVYSDKHEKQVAKELGGYQVSNSGAGKFHKGDVIVPSASLLVECKTPTTERKSFAISKNWIKKNKEERFENRLSNSAIAFNFEPDGENYYVIDSILMKFLIVKLEEEENNYKEQLVND